MRATLEPREAVRLVTGYAKSYGAGAFATPLAKDLSPEDCTMWSSTEGSAVITLGRRLRTASVRHDFTGARFTLPAGWRVATNVARLGDEPVPDLEEFDAVLTYAEDTALTEGMRAYGRSIMAVQITAASEIVNCWGPPGSTRTYGAADLATAVSTGKAEQWRPAAVEASSLADWTDDFPYYSDGSWSAVSLRGYRPDDPSWGIKPAEMPKSWKAEHPEAARYVCGWTTLSRKTPGCVAAVRSLPFKTEIERVRLLRMAGTGHGHLSRHCDITDRAAGTADGRIARFHLPLVSHPAIYMSVWELDGKRRDLHLGVGQWYYLDARKPHAVTNPTTTDRLHLVVDVVSNRAVRSLIEAAA